MGLDNTEPVTHPTKNDSLLKELAQSFWTEMGDKKPTFSAISDATSPQQAQWTPDVSQPALPAGSDVSQDAENSDNESFLIVKGVRLSHVAYTQLMSLGMPLEWYTAAELEDAVQACSADANLIDDPHGDNFQDSLDLDPEEIAAKQAKQAASTIPESEDQIIFTGMRIFYDPYEVQAHKNMDEEHEMEEFNHLLPPKVRPPRRLAESPSTGKRPVIAECDEEIIFAGMRILYDPKDVETASPPVHGLEIHPQPCEPAIYMDN